MGVLAMTSAAIAILGAQRFEVLVRRTVEIQPAYIGEIDSWQAAAMRAVDEQAWTPRYGWSQAARGVALSLTISAAIESERRSAEVAA